MEPKVEQSTDDGNVGIPSSARRRLEILEEARELIVSRVSMVVGEALNRMGEELTSLAVDSRSREEQQVLLEAVSVVRNYRPQIELRFRRSFADVFERRLFNRHVEGEGRTGEMPSEENGDELSLVDDSVIKDQLAIDKAVHRSRSKLDPEQTLGIRARLAALLERDWFDEKAHPASPEAVYEALTNAVAEVASQPQVKAALLDAFEPHVTSNLNTIYCNVNERLKANRVLPKIRPKVAVPAAGESPRPSSPAASPAARHAGNGAPGGSGGHGVPAGALNEHHRIHELVNTTLSELSQGLPEARLQAARLLTDPDMFGMADLPLPAVEPPLLESLGQLQTTAAVAPVTGAVLLGELTDRARDAGSPLDQLTVEIVSLVFDYIYNDKRLADPIKQQLLRLQVVAVKAALIDRSFFARRQHPMRRLIDRMTDLATDPDAEVHADAPLVKGMAEVVDWVLVKFDTDLATFEQALERIEALAGKEAERRAEQLARLTDEAARGEALAKAAEEAMSQLSVRIDRQSPAFMKDFMYRWWAQVIAEAQVAGGEAPVTGDEALRTAEALIWSVAPKGAHEIPRLAALLPKLIGGLMQGLKLVRMPIDERETFFAALLRAHTEAIEEAKLQPARPMAERMAAPLRMRSDGTIQFTSQGQRGDAPPTEEAPTLLARGLLDAELKRGDRVEVDLGEGARAFKVAWISPSQQLYVLTRFPDEAHSVQRPELAQLFEAGKARVIERRSSLDRALESINAKPAPG